ncbi:tetratricopeptide repeat protein [Flavobacteriaceae bacterium S356]|uniref:Tetratricopeptide repeat protein n=1 Tax=Asprobacillus argus TaxID=3076534 RepID=A0ABU3LEQ4_9FLAO|nr:tetratricopeptide repeat protein [Flavobacteriaceae bacterium S356]
MAPNIKLGILLLYMVACYQWSFGQEFPNGKIVEQSIELGEKYYRSGLYNEAVNQYKKALDHIDKKNSSHVLIDLQNDIGCVYLSMNNYSAAKLFFEEALQGSQQIHYQKGNADAQGYLGVVHEKQGDYLTALSFQKRSLDIFTNINDQVGIALINENIGSIFEDLQKYDLAHTYFTDAYQILKGSDTKEEANVLNNIGDTYRKRHIYTKAKEYTSMSLKLSKQLKDYNLLASAYKDLAKTHALLNDYKNAYISKLASDDFHKKALLNQNADQINTLQVAYASEKQKSQIQLLQEQNKVIKANETLLIVTFACSSIIAIILLIYYSKKRASKAKLQTYKQRTLQAELAKKEIEEKNLQKDIQLKTTALSRYSLHLSQKNKILADLSSTLKNIANRSNINYEKKIKEITKEIDFNLKQENEWEEFKVFFKDIHPNFVKKLSNISEENLSPSELKLGILLRLNLSSKEIASILRVTPDSVRVARHRLRKKLPIDSKEDLVNFMLAI